MIKMTPEVERWVEAQRMESRYAHLVATGRVVSTAERLRSGVDNFDRLSELHRQLLRGRARRGDG